MPLLQEWNSDAFSLAGIWKIEEPLSFFEAETGLHFDIKNEKRRIERLAGRFLLQKLQFDFPVKAIYPDEHDKPRIPDNQYYFSISHSWPYVAAVISPYVETGIDIQMHHPRMSVLQHKFLSKQEQDLFIENEHLLTMAWCAKEAAYKWQGRRGVDFIEDMPIESVYEMYNGAQGKKYNIVINLNLTAPKTSILIQSTVNKDFACAFVSNSG